MMSPLQTRLQSFTFKVNDVSICISETSCKMMHDNDVGNPCNACVLNNTQQELHHHLP